MATHRISRDRIEITRFQLKVVNGPDSPHRVESTGSELTIGSDPGHPLRLTDPCVSRQHCMLRVSDEGVVCTDLGSTNGTLVTGRRITSAILLPGDTITVGETTIAFDLLPDTVSEPLSVDDRFGRVLGRSVAMRRLFAIAERVAAADATILIDGETGTGKSALAEAIHEHSPRKDKPFIVVDCGALPGTLLESELFGHERGAFTGALESRLGLFESADGGTILLDEIGELPLDLQPKLLRVLERRVIRKVGASRERPIDVRLIAATHRDLRCEVNRKTFRSDLWYRLNTVRITMPPLRERRDDIAMLVWAIYQDLLGDRSAMPPTTIVRQLMRGNWPGNVRELRSAVERSLLGAPVSDAAFDAGPTSFRDAKIRATADWERRYLADLLAAHDGNVSRAARSARMNRSHLSELIHRHGLVAEPMAAEPEDRSDADGPRGEIPRSA
ncbi:MAG TPA: sigma 54-interacting transcriptional regulator [Kofleriaceae bacterium]